MAEQNWVRVLARADLPPGGVAGLEIGENWVAVYNVAGTYYATDNFCTHGAALLSDGWLEDNVIECPLHGGRFDVTSGAAVEEPAECPLKTFPVRVNGEDVEVLMPE